MKTQPVEQTKRRRKGQGLVEFALVMPILLLLLMGVIDFGWMIFNYTQLYNGLREGLRYGSVASFDPNKPQYYNCDGIRQSIKATAPMVGVQSNNITVAYDTGDNTVTVGTCPSGTNGFVKALDRDLQNGDRVVVTIDMNVKFLTPLISTFAPGGVHMYFKAARSVYPSGVKL